MAFAAAHPFRSPGREALRIALSPRRWFWAGLLILHGAALPSLFYGLIASAPEGGRLATLLRLLGLAASAGVFALKLIDVSWLRLPSGWRARVSVAIVVGLLHWGVMARVTGGETQLDAAPWGMVLALGGASCASPTARRLQQFMLARAKLDVESPRREFDRGVRRAWLDLVPAPRLQFFPSLSVPRAPPVC